eukprot:5656252-Amphidinium_carterae.1
MEDCAVRLALVIHLANSQANMAPIIKLPLWQLRHEEIPQLLAEQLKLECSQTRLKQGDGKTRYLPKKMLLLKQSAPNVPCLDNLRLVDNMPLQVTCPRSINYQAIGSS